MNHIHNPVYLERADYTWSKSSVRLINTPTLTARKTYFYVQEAGDFQTAAPYFTERENLNSFLIIHTLSGRGVLNYLGGTYELPPLSTIWISCMEHHLYRCPPDSHWDFLWLHFNGATSLGYYEELLKNGFRILHNTDSDFMQRTLRTILSLTQKKELHSEILVSNLIMELLTQLLIANSTENLHADAMPAYINKVIKKINTHFAEPLSLDMLAREFCVSKYHLSREFKRYSGTPPNEYLILTRLSHAKELLKYSEQTVEEIAFASGFCNVSHFISLFKAREGTTPLQYRKLWAHESNGGAGSG